MFARTQDSPVLSELCLQHFCVSLNAPVLDFEGLPVATARAAIVVFSEEYGDLAAALAVRSLEGGEVAIFRYRGQPPRHDQSGRVLEQALTWGEGLGFLFDDDLVATRGADGRAEALDYWIRLTGDGAGLADDRASAEVDLGDPLDLEPPQDAMLPSMEDLLEPADELLSLTDEVDDADADSSNSLLTDSAILAPVLDLEELSLKGAGGASSTGPEQAARPAVPPIAVGRQDAELPEQAEPVVEAMDLEVAIEEPPAPDLTKFRRALDPEAEGAARPTNVETGEGGNQLGRIPIVRLRKGRDPSRPSHVARLLASF